MKKVYITLLFSVFSLFFSSAVFSQSNFITLGNLGTTSFCPNGTLSVPFTTNLPVGTMFNVYVSDASGFFGSQTQIGSGIISPISVTFPTHISSGTGYLIRITSVSPSVTSSLSGSLTTNGMTMAISVKNLAGRDIAGEVCQGSALTGIINTNQSNVNYEWKRNGIYLTNNSSFRIVSSGNYTVSSNKTGCENASYNFNIAFVTSVKPNMYGEGLRHQCNGSSYLIKNTYFSDSATYQWKKDGIIINGKNKDTIVVSQTGKYSVDTFDKCIVDNSLNTIPYTLYFGDKLQNEISPILKYGINSDVLCGNNSFIRISSIAGDNENPLSPYLYQWKKNNVNILNATSKYFGYVNEEGIYTLTLRQGNCTVLSNAVTITKVDTIKLKLKIRDNYSDSICPGMSTLLQEEEVPWLHIKCLRNGVIFDDFPWVNQTGFYKIVGKSDGCTIIPSDSIKITVGNTPKPVIINSTPKLCNGSTGLLTSYSYGSSFQWYKNNILIPSATLPYLYVNQTGFYKVRVTKGACSGFSDSTLFQISNVLNKPIFKEPYPNEIELCNNNIIVFYQYRQKDNLDQYDSLLIKRNGTITRQENKSIIMTQPGTYTVIGKQGTCLSPESDPVEIKIGEPITANITGSTSIYPGQKAKLNLSFTGGNAWSYQTSDVATGQTTSSSPMLKTVSPTSTQTYSITSVASNCGVGTVTGSATVTVLPCPTTQAISLNNGNWNTASTWVCGQIPTPTLDTIIEQGHTVNLPNGYQGNTKKLELKGNLTQGAGASVRVSN
jgi:trimeric autotransporter adhesin